MNTLRQLIWPLIIVLGILGLVRPLARIVFEGAQLPTPVIALSMTLLVTIVWMAGCWVLGLGLSRAANPLLGGIATGLVYAIGAIVLSAILSPILLGHLEGPLSNPFAIVPMLLTNAVWGAIVGGLALVVRRIRWGTWTTGRVQP